MPEYRSASGSAAEDLFIDLFAETFGAEKAGYLYSQYPFYDIYQNARFADFVLENGATRVAIEIDDEASHNPRLVSQDKFYDDLLKQNSMIHLGWDVYRWAVRQMQKQPETVKDELRVFLGSDPRFKEIEDYLPTQHGRALKADQLELREYQQEALDSLESMRQNRETIALLYHATGTGKTVTAVMDAKRCGGRVLFVAHTMELVNQAYNTFRDLWPEVTVGKFADNLKEPDAHVVCGSIQSVALKLILINQISKLRGEGCTRFAVSMDCDAGLYAAEILHGLQESDEEFQTICYVPYEEQATKWTPELWDRYFNALTACTEVINVAYEKDVGCEFKAYLEAINEVDTVIAVYDPDDPRCEREAAAVTVAEMLNRQVITVDPKTIRLS